MKADGQDIIIAQTRGKEPTWQEDHHADRRVRCGRKSFVSPTNRAAVRFSTTQILAIKNARFSKPKRSFWAKNGRKGTDMKELAVAIGRLRHRPTNRSLKSPEVMKLRSMIKNPSDMKQCKIIIRYHHQISSAMSNES